ncbi:MAG: DUF4465 domain-containing protein [Paludibacter sp.]|nr:DUF4465 domain-containing protein [Paludibacter sp.]
MRKNRFFIWAVLIAICSFGFSSCESEDEGNKVITFEDVDLGVTGYWNGSDKNGTPRSYDAWGTTVTEYAGSFVSGNLTCDNVYNETYNSWSEMACSSHTDMDSIGYGNQYSVYATSGAGGSEKFAVICPFDSATCSFNQETDIKSLMINNATYTYLTLRDGTDGTGYARQFTTDDYYYITITGFDTNGLKTSSIDYYLADFRNGKSYICKDWTPVNLKSLGKIKSLSFKLTSSDSSFGYMNTPGYACIDNIVYSRE